MSRGRFLVLAALLAGCAARPPAPDATAIPVAPGVTLALPRPGDLGATLEAAQMVTAHYQGHDFVFEGHLKATPDRFTLVGLDSLGREAMSIDWTDQGIAYRAAPFVPDTLRPEDILADIVLEYWPEAVVRKALGNAGGDLEAGGDQRSLSVGGKKLIEIDYRKGSSGDPWNGALAFRNLAWGYEIDIQSVETGR